jgi:dihydroorotase-like cyclic amidohydrolase
MLLIKNIFLYDPASGVEKKTDILIEDGRFAKIEDNISPEEMNFIQQIREALE